MSFESLGDYLRALEEAGEVKRIKASVDIDLEVAEILRRTMYSGGPALLFENIEGYDMPILGNAFGSLRRMQIALGTEQFECYEGPTLTFNATIRSKRGKFTLRRKVKNKH